LGQLRGHQRFLTTKYEIHKKGMGNLATRNAENAEKKGFGKNGALIGKI
jgi:hypothetical protein